MKIRTQWMKKRIKSFGGQVIFGSRLYHPLLTKSAVVVVFHRVNNTPPGDGLTCSVEMFAKYCRFFARYFHVISLRDLMKKIETRSLLNCELAITFDDGYQDNYEYATPVLRAMGLPATFFVVTQFIGTKFVPWWDKGLSMPPSWMTWDQVRLLHREGFEIGAHTRTHIDLGKVSGNKAKDEIVGSRLELEEQLSAPVDLFAYPYGGKEQMGDETREIVKAAGFRCCFSCFGGINSMATDLFHLRRIPISSWYESPHHFGCELALYHS